MGNLRGLIVLALASACGRAAVSNPARRATSWVPPKLAEKLRLVQVIDGLARPVDLAFAPGDPRNRMFVAEQHTGRIVAFEGGKRVATPFLDLFHGKLAQGDEVGLFSLAFHPDFATNGRLFVWYLDRSNRAHLVEYRAPRPDADAVDEATAREWLTAASDEPYHHGGERAFGADGKIYLSIGDGGPQNDGRRTAQNPKQLLGKLIRLDVGSADTRPEIIAAGLRNPWRYDLDPKTGDLYLGDVGQDTWESVYVAPAASIVGKNFGWSETEGGLCFRDPKCDRSRFAAPTITYTHDDGCSVIGGLVYRGQALPELDGTYFYADYCGGWLRSFRWDQAGVRDHWDWKPLIDAQQRPEQIVSFARDPQGELYLVSLDGLIWKLVAR